MVESMKSEPRPPLQAGGGVVPDGGGSGLYDGPSVNGGVINNGVAHHPLSSANPPGLPRPAMPHTHGHSHLIAAPGGVLNNATLQHNGSPMTRLAHQRKSQPHTLFSRNKGKQIQNTYLHTTKKIVLPYQVSIQQVLDRNFVKSQSKYVKFNFFHCK